MENCCLGSRKFVTSEEYQWYVPNEKQASEVTYCQWCYQNNCFEKDMVYQMSPKVTKASCDCPKDHSTLSKRLAKMQEIVNRGPIECPSCYFRGTAGRMCSQTETSCKYCRGYTPSPSFPVCYACCVLRGICFSCNQQFKSGNEYFDEFWEKFQPERAQNSTNYALMVLHTLRGKTREEIMDAILDEELYKKPEDKQKRDHEAQLKLVQDMMRNDEELVPSKLNWSEFLRKFLRK